MAVYVLKKCVVRILRFFFSSKAIQTISFSVFQTSVRTERPVIGLGRPRKCSGHFKVFKRGLSRVN